ncbi:MAG: sugar ABC transporter ATP-binding protein, partial [Brevinematales bacterium]
AIARVLDISAKILILDEPTSSLDENEVKLLFGVLKKLRDNGLAILFVTHFLDQAYEISDRITVLKNGNKEGEYISRDLAKVELISKMLGKELSEFSYSQKETVINTEGKKIRDSKEVLLKAENLARKGSIAPVDLDISRGEILGFAGLLGSGRTETARLLFGIDKADQGDIFIKGKKKNMNNPSNAINAGLGFCPEDRKVEGIIDQLSVRENIILALQGKKGIFKNMPMKKQQETAENLIKMLGIITTGTEQEVRRLSGGNQQKVMLARWLATDPEILILDEPTRGIDVGAKLEIMELVLNLAKKGMALLFISSEIDEVVRCSSKVEVFKDREKINELTGGDIDVNSIMHIIAGGN